MSKLFNKLYPNNPTSGAIVGACVYLILSIIKIYSGTKLHSSSVYADGLNNLTDIISSLTIFVGIFIARKPTDIDHHFDHNKYETIASFIVSLAMFSIGLEVVRSGINRFINKDFLISDPLLIKITIFSTVLLFATYIYVKRLSIASNSIGLKTTAQEMLNDILITIGTLIGTIITQFGYPVFDVFISIFVGLLTIYSSYTIFKESTYVLSDGFRGENLDKYKDFVLKQDGVKDVTHIRGRISGSKVYLDLVILVDGNLSVFKSHKITEVIETKLMEQYGIDDVDVHVEPNVELDTLPNDDVKSA